MTHTTCPASGWGYKNGVAVITPAGPGTVTGWQGNSVVVNVGGQEFTFDPAAITKTRQARGRHLFTEDEYRVEAISE